MNPELQFDIDEVTVVEFGVGLDNGNEEMFVSVPADAGVQDALREMVQATWEAIQNHQDGPAKYEPSEKYGTTEYLYLPLSDDLAESVRQLHTAAQLELDPAALNEPDKVFCYFARFKDKAGQRLTALRRTTQFKGLLKSKNRLIRLLDDTLKVVEDTVFKLDRDFDLLVDDANVHIWRPSGFAFVGRLNQAILDAVPNNIEEIRGDLSFMDLDSIEEYAGKHPRAARYLASIRTQGAAKNIQQERLLELCKRTGVEIVKEGGKYVVSPGSELAFLEVLDRRRYELELVEGEPERFRAASRRKLHG